MRNPVSCDENEPNERLGRLGTRQQSKRTDVAFPRRTPITRRALPAWVAIKARYNTQTESDLVPWIQV
jgi:hypothetical protein